MVPKEDKGIHMLVGPENMKAVSESTYIAVQKLEPRTLRFVLRGYGLSDEELDAAEERLENLKFQLHKGYQQHCLDHQAGNANTPKFKRKSIAILKDNEWKDLSKQDVEALISGNNYFSRAVIEVKEMKQTLGSQKKKYKKLASDVAIGGDNRAIDGGLGREQKRTKDLLDGMNRVTNHGFWHAHFGTSEAFEDMRAAVEEYQEYQKQLELRIKEANSPQRRNDPAYADKGYVSANELMTLARLSKRVEETADVYLEKKGPEEEITNPYTRSRVQMAKLAKEFGKKGAVRSEEELETVRKNESRAVEKLGRAANAQIEGIEKSNLIQGPG